MPRKPRIYIGGEIHHVINRIDGRRRLFRSGKDYRRFCQTLAEALARFRMRLLAYCVMPNHWHLLVWPQGDGDLSSFMQWLTVTHTRRHHVRKGTVGTGHIYQGRYKAHLVQSDEHLKTVCRYIERNAVEAHLVSRVRYWKWGSGRQRILQASTEDLPALSAWPLETPQNWELWVDEKLSNADSELVRESVVLGTPLGDERWINLQGKRFGFPWRAKQPGRRRSGIRT